jgi:hypothetical protein
MSIKLFHLEPTLTVGTPSFTSSRTDANRGGCLFCLIRDAHIILYGFFFFCGFFAVCLLLRSADKYILFLWGHLPKSRQQTALKGRQINTAAD